MKPTWLHDDSLCHTFGTSSENHRKCMENDGHMGDLLNDGLSHVIFAVT